eukprot:TRINITY_DN2535_c0_g1_i1.p1 TRINITY_DN2535_c0_g1~~TRINITY_DN2535_c0_g1_i1.p1  ORF type:complete len:191 (+),score=18.40 TRINITY_DN2535_c0_g1_i1:76-648(+)
MIGLVSVLLLLVVSVFGEPSLLLRKSVGFPEGTVNVPTVGKELIVTLTVFNVGSESAFDVHLTDLWPELDITIGTDTAKWDRIPAGSNFTHTYIIVPDRSGDFKGRRAVVQYSDAKGVIHETASNEPYGIRVYELNEVDKRGGSRLSEWVGFFLLVLIVVGLPAARYTQIKNNYVGGVAIDDPVKKKKNQ